MKHKCGGLMPIMIEDKALFRVHCQYCLDEFEEIRLNWISQIG